MRIFIIKNSLVLMCDINFSERKSRDLKERSSSARNLKSGRDTRNEDYFGKADPLQITSRQSKEYSKADYQLSEFKNHSKNLNQNTEYIKSLYKKYLGKENVPTKSERKQKAEAGIVRNLFSKENKCPKPSAQPLKDNLVMISSSNTQQSHCKQYEEETEPATYSNSKYTLSKNKSTISIQFPTCKKAESQEQPCSDFYAQMMNETYLELLGNPRNSLVLCMKQICRAKKIALKLG